MPNPTAQDHEDCTWAASIMLAARKIEAAPDVWTALSDTIHAFDNGTKIPRLTLSRARQAVRAFKAKRAEIIAERA